MQSYAIQAIVRSWVSNASMFKNPVCNLFKRDELGNQCECTLLSYAISANVINWAIIETVISRDIHGTVITFASNANSIACTIGATMYILKCNHIQTLLTSIQKNNHKYNQWASNHLSVQLVHPVQMHSGVHQQNSWANIANALICAMNVHTKCSCNHQIHKLIRYKQVTNKQLCNQHWQKYSTTCC